MTAVNASPRLASRLVNGVLAVKPLANLAKHQARTMMIKRAESIGVYWRDEVKVLRSRCQPDTQPAPNAELSPDWEADLARIQNPALDYPEYYLRSFHAYDEGNLGWEAAMEVEVAAYAVHARIWPDAGVQGDTRLRQSYHDILRAQLSTEPRDILDLGCSVGMSTFALQQVFPQAKLTGLDLSPYFLAIAHYHTSLSTFHFPLPIWVHAAAESTGLPDHSFDLISASLLFHELPRTAAVQIFREARRLLRPGGYLTIMDMNPKSDVHSKMPPYVLTLLKSTEPYLDDYFTFDIEGAIASAGFTQPTVTCNSPRHRTLVAQVC
ncbi:MAG: class I SAM-dependent methyltransferase [Leptolyngbyaceae cyanobacterium RM2_2_4]|nr:class I SAM-dependent methyltransferase [Leptolyngbyaceae cyanobacterium SM1_4_3]NJN89290.1 class I SAM-dependent methyltransferase [Leptolyngbyaceae cyanobacterium SL_5_14]NJO51451.1 class I SAM-dependent methyltransferase [Leptolyngbyaceae cyanobacterium RM2_2_4]NJO66660.1 class I SAM-dependent methyltransferase [Leptolyngbyaceae cyanobacterium RM1_405_57]